MDDERRRERERAGGEDAFLPLRPDQERQLARKHVEEVAVGAVDVRRGAVAVRAEPRPGHDELRAVAEDLDSALRRIPYDLALTRY